MSPFRFLRKLSKKGACGILLLGLAISVAFGVAGSMEDGPLSRLDRLFLDTCLTLAASGKTAQNTVVVDVDDVSLAAVGQWPWPRYRIAELVRAIAAKKPAVIGLDVIFPEPDQTSLDSIRRSFLRDFNLDLSFVGAPPGLSDNDDYLGHVLAEAGAVGSRYFYFDLVSKTAAPPPVFRFTGRTDLLKLNDAPGLLDNTERIASRLTLSGFMNTQSDRDGLVRTVPLLIQYRGQIYPHLALATFMRSLGIESATIEESVSGPVIVVGKRTIPIDARAYAMPRLAGAPKLYPAISALDVLNGDLREQDIKGKVVFIGSSAAALNDFHQTIFDAQFPGLKMLAAITEDLSTGDFVRQPSWGRAAILAASLIVGMFVSVIFVYYANPLRLGLGTFVAVVIFPLLSVYAILSFGVFVSPMAPSLLAATLFALFAFVGYGVEKRRAYLWFKKIANARQVTMESMAAVAETRDPETGAHIKRTQGYVKITAERLRRDKRYVETLTDDYIELLFVSAPLHDIGKVGVPDHILLKPGKLTNDEFAIMKRHTEYGRHIIQSSMQSIQGDNFLYLAGEIAASHHEKWDGTGYPLGLAGENIPLSGRIMAIADVYDALISRRCYKLPMSHELAMGIIGEDRGKRFDPLVVDAFFAEQVAVQAIAAEYRDQQESTTGCDESTG
jgi:CHASE2 domain-containing sensor protein